MSFNANLGKPERITRTVETITLSLPNMDGKSPSIANITLTWSHDTIHATVNMPSTLVLTADSMVTLRDGIRDMVNLMLGVS